MFSLQVKCVCSFRQIIPHTKADFGFGDMTNDNWIHKKTLLDFIKCYATHHSQQPSVVVSSDEKENISVAASSEEKENISVAICQSNSLSNCLNI